MLIAIAGDRATILAALIRGESQIEMRTKIKQQGFTLLEIMLVVSIIVIILGVAISKLGNTTAIAKSMRRTVIVSFFRRIQPTQSFRWRYPIEQRIHHDVEIV